MNEPQTTLLGLPELDYTLLYDLDIKELLALEQINKRITDLLDDQFWDDWFYINDTESMNIAKYHDGKYISMFVHDIIHPNRTKDATKIIQGKHYGLLRFMIKTGEMDNDYIIPLMKAAQKQKDYKTIDILLPVLLEKFENCLQD